MAAATSSGPPLAQISLELFLHEQDFPAPALEGSAGDCAEYRESPTYLLAAADFLCFETLVGVLNRQPTRDAAVVRFVWPLPVPLPPALSALLLSTDTPLCFSLALVARDCDREGLHCATVRALPGVRSVHGIPALRARVSVCCPPVLVLRTAMCPAAIISNEPMLKLRLNVAGFSGLPGANIASATSKARPSRNASSLLFALVPRDSCKNAMNGALLPLPSAAEFMRNPSVMMFLCRPCDACTRDTRIATAKIVLPAMSVNECAYQNDVTGSRAQASGFEPFKNSTRRNNLDVRLYNEILHAKDDCCPYEEIDDCDGEHDDESGAESSRVRHVVSMRSFMHAAMRSEKPCTLARAALSVHWIRFHGGKSRDDGRSKDFVLLPLDKFEDTSSVSSFPLKQSSYSYCDCCPQSFSDATAKDIGNTGMMLTSAQVPSPLNSNQAKISCSEYTKQLGKAANTALTKANLCPVDQRFGRMDSLLRSMDSMTIAQDSSTRIRSNIKQRDANYVLNIDKFFSGKSRQEDYLLPSPKTPSIVMKNNSCYDLNKKTRTSSLESGELLCESITSTQNESQRPLTPRQLRDSQTSRRVDFASYESHEPNTFVNAELRRCESLPAKLLARKFGWLSLKSLLLNCGSQVVVDQLRRFDTLFFESVDMNGVRAVLLEVPIWMDGSWKQSSTLVEKIEFPPGTRKLSAKMILQVLGLCSEDCFSVSSASSLYQDVLMPSVKTLLTELSVSVILEKVSNSCDDIEIDVDFINGFGLLGVMTFSCRKSTSFFTPCSNSLRKKIPSLFIG